MFQGMFWTKRSEYVYLYFVPSRVKGVEGENGGLAAKQDRAKVAEIYSYFFIV